MYSRIVMKIRDILNISLVLSVILSLTECTRDVLQSQGADTIVEFSLLPVQMSNVSVDSKSVRESIDEGTAANYTVADFWFFEYDAGGNLLGTPRYYDIEDYDSAESLPVSVILPNTPGVIYKAIVIANTHDASFLTGISYNTLTALKSSSKKVKSSADLYHGSDILMNGIADITSSTTAVECFLYRNVAKISLKIKNEDLSGIQINSVQVMNVPDRLFVADQMYAGESVFPDQSVVKYVNLEKDEVKIQEGSETQLMYYLPRNMQGVNNSITEAGKNVNAPECATYIEVLATRTTPCTKVRYRFYPGANNIDDFNIVPNHQYEITLDFSIFGDFNDNRVEDLSVIKLEDSNSYIINPTDGSAIKYVVPIENRINTYWKSESGMLNDDWEDYLIGQGQDWVAEVIWQDVNKQVIQFVNEEGTTSDTYTGLADDRYFSFVTTDDAVGNTCNVVIGVRCAGDGWSETEDGYMWSWHLWLTDYDPYEYVGQWVDGVYDYPVTGGSLHRYSSFDDIAGFADANVYIMDRNFGAKGYKREHGWSAAAGTMYQFGRKDPFPINDNVYDITGTQNRTISRLSGVIAINETVVAPMSFVKQTRDGVYDWSSEDRYRSYDWNDILLKASGGKGKSLFDPCPPGWKLPTNMIWSHFGNKNTAHASNWVSTKPEDNTYSTSGTRFDAGWLYYLNAKEMSGGMTYYPGSGMRSYSTGVHAGSANGALWSSQPAGNAGVYLYYDNVQEKYTLSAQGFYRYMGMPVRCITDN